MVDDIMTDETKLKLLKKKASYFFENKLPVHVSYKKTEQRGEAWANGYIIEIYADFFILNEFHEGQIYIWFLELKDIDEYNSVGKEKGNE